MRFPVRQALALAMAVLTGVSVLAPPVPVSADPGDQDPYGTFESAFRTGHSVRVRGVVHDPDASAAITVAITVDGWLATYAGADSTGAFDTTMASSIVPGEHNVCAEAYNQGAGANTWLGCLVYSVPEAVGTPQVSLRAVSATEVVVEWTPADANASSFRVERTFDGSWSTVATLGWDARSWTESGLAPGTAVCVNVVAVNDFSEQGAAVCGTSLKSSLPLLWYPQVQFVSTTETTITMRWTDSSVAAGYRADAYDGADEVASTFVERVGPGPYEATLTGLRPGRFYRLHVRPVHPEHETSSGAYPYSIGAVTLMYPEIISLAVAPSANVGCTVGRQLVAQAQYAERLEIRRDDVVVAASEFGRAVYDLPFGDTATYTAVATNKAGTEATRKIAVSRDTRAPLVKELQVTNTRQHSLGFYLYTSEDNELFYLGWVDSGKTATITIPHGVLGVVVAKEDVRSEISYNMGYAVMGHCGGAAAPITI
ncbi:fibronectin type III domain-containing protein [Micromonospora sp. R77]|uniref:fibronectin type III domain-containing protein n=1 Tax=Micromonospora sp. R77 TaxID=2925836 RepID=UPI001F60EF5B|nr:fibronectin type III domain-containing protein [Micromonospora sp. R77]MCI4066148.1 fibronectin type III domain-containing protein [Micromonospora sp. R77]